MTFRTCSLCATGFVARSDALYCSSACRQKAHRARVARRTADLGARHTARSAHEDRSDAPKSLRRALAASMQRAREQVDLSRKLCRQAERRMQRNAAIRHDIACQPSVVLRRAAAGEGVP